MINIPIAAWINPSGFITSLNNALILSLCRRSCLDDIPTDLVKAGGSSQVEWSDNVW